MDESDIRNQLKPGARVRVTQQIAARDYTWSADVRGTIVQFQQKQTGSWFAHAKNDKLWLDRLVIKKDDGEITTLNLDEYSRVELEPPSSAAPPAAGATPKQNESDLPA
ncbi:MAG TPA: hypothetical protein VER17_21270 [Tepidisphaeraceae bacterium]|nr:hypothetical protein [Tepidisphaeraceae bacterium]